jgi:hypothetical protein
MWPTTLNRLRSEKFGAIVQYYHSVDKFRSCAKFQNVLHVPGWKDTAYLVKGSYYDIQQLILLFPPSHRTLLIDPTWGFHPVDA